MDKDFSILILCWINKKTIQICIILITQINSKGFYLYPVLDKQKKKTIPICVILITQAIAKDFYLDSILDLKPTFPSFLNSSYTDQRFWTSIFLIIWLIGWCYFAGSECVQHTASRYFSDVT